MVENKFGWKVGDTLAWETEGRSIKGEVIKVSKVMVEFETEGGMKTRMKGDNPSISHRDERCETPASKYDLAPCTEDPAKPGPAVVDGYQTFWVAVEMANGDMIDVFVKTPTEISGNDEISEVYPWIREALGQEYGKKWVRISTVMPGNELSGNIGCNIPTITATRT